MQPYHKNASATTEQNGTATAVAEAPLPSALEATLKATEAKRQDIIPISKGVKNKPEKKKEEKPVQFHPQLLLPRDFGGIAALCATDSVRYALKSVRLQIDQEKQQVVAYATDGRFLGKLTAPLVTGEEFPGDGVAWSAADAGMLEAAVPARQWTEAFKMVPTTRESNGKPIIENLAVSLGVNTVTMGATNLETVRTITARQEEGRFPPVEEVLPKASPVFSAWVDPLYLAQLLSVVRSCGIVNDDNRGVELRCYGPNMPLEVRGANRDTGMRFRGIIMPLTRSAYEDMEGNVAEYDQQHGKHNATLAPAMYQHLRRMLDAIKEKKLDGELKDEIKVAGDLMSEYESARSNTRRKKAGA